jgi:hypothetical protein
LAGADQPTLESEVDEERKIVRLLGRTVDPAKKAEDVVRFCSEHRTRKTSSLYSLME